MGEPTNIHHIYRDHPPYQKGPDDVWMCDLDGIHYCYTGGRWTWPAPPMWDRNVTDPEILKKLRRIKE